MRRSRGMQPTALALIGALAACTQAGIVTAGAVEGADEMLDHPGAHGYMP